MKFTDEEIKRRLEDFNQHFEYVDEEIQIVLKGHLVIEDILNRIIGQFVFHPTILEEIRLSFHSKVYLAKAFSVSEQENSIWKIILSINKIRNRIAHVLAPEGRQDAIENLKTLYMQEMRGSSEENVWNDKGTNIGLYYSIGLAFGFLTSFEKEARDFNLIIKNLTGLI